eukprot:TRINITY_DN97_c0_g1::TRINITY_DN97_c0_g1_i1::g.14746::m.14746 TRINITY_DN97_c0_g1::TRINITY_DN97_c0_g1_i1::g.14746  ORF type:complete len:340 (+),score=20.90,sp/Q70VZ7/MOGT1_BOVIN/47.90/4e-100,DAGAT/PF03982.8/2.1e-106 TRINITY_DN97_c0_g1_i1:110-1129(+)
MSEPETYNPWKVPLERRLQTAAVFLWGLTLFGGFYGLSLSLFFLLISPVTAALFLIYLVWATFFDDAPIKGDKRFCQRIRNSRFWKYFVAYFPMKLHKTVDLDASKNYLFGYHPHGIISVGALGNFGTNGTGFCEMFPGIDLRVMTLKVNFATPFFREYLLALGLRSVEKDSCMYNLSRGPGASILIVVGGAQEALDAHPNTYDLTVLKRKGFVKVALETGASLVPVISFGENDVFLQADNPEGSPVRFIQEKFKSVMGFSLPIFWGRGVFSRESWGLLPLRRPINTVVGRPIDCPKTAKPSEAMVEEYHQKYLAGLREVYDQHKSSFAVDRKRTLIFR